MTAQQLFEALSRMTEADRHSQEVFVARQQPEQGTGYGLNDPVTEIVRRNGNAVTFVLGYFDKAWAPKKRQLP